MNKIAFSQSTRFQRQKGKQFGFLSVEALIVLIVVLALLGIAASRSGMLSGGSQAVEEVGNIQSLYANIKSLKTSSGYGAAGTNLVPALITADGIPKNMSVVSGVPYNDFGGAVQIVSTGSGFTITTNGLSSAACVKQSTSISRGGAFATTQIGSNAAINGEVTSATASSQCTGSANTVTWTSVS